MAHKYSSRRGLDTNSGEEEVPIKNTPAQEDRPEKVLEEKAKKESIWQSMAGHKDKGVLLYLIGPDCSDSISAN